MRMMTILNVYCFKRQLYKMHPQHRPMVAASVPVTPLTKYYWSIVHEATGTCSTSLNVNLICFIFLIFSDVFKITTLLSHYNPPI